MRSAARFGFAFLSIRDIPACGRSRNPDAFKSKEDAADGSQPPQGRGAPVSTAAWVPGRVEDDKQGILTTARSASDPRWNRERHSRGSCESVEVSYTDWSFRRKTTRTPARPVTRSKNELGSGVLITPVGSKATSRPWDADCDPSSST